MEPKNSFFMTSVFLRSFFHQNIRHISVNTDCTKKQFRQGKKIWQFHFQIRDCTIKTKHQNEFQVILSFEQKSCFVIFHSTQNNKFWDKLNLISWVYFFLLRKENLVLEAIENWWSCLSHG